MLKNLIRTLCLLPVLIAAHSVNADYSHEIDIQREITPKVVSSLSTLLTESEVESIARQRLGVLGVGGSNVDLDRIGTSNMFRTSFGGSMYIVNDDARFWQPFQPVREMSSNGIIPFTALAKEVSNYLDLIQFIESVKEHLIVYPAVGQTKETVYAFMDISCPHCAKFHQIDSRTLTQSGYEVVYIPFLRQPSDKKARHGLTKIFCTIDPVERRVAFDAVIGSYKTYRSQFIEPPKGCDNQHGWLYRELMLSGGRHQFLGSPTFVLEAGHVFFGASGLMSYIQ